MSSRPFWLKTFAQVARVASTTPEAVDRPRVRNTSRGASGNVSMATCGVKMISNTGTSTVVTSGSCPKWEAISASTLDTHVTCTHRHNALTVPVYALSVYGLCRKATGALLQGDTNSVCTVVTLGKRRFKTGSAQQCLPCSFLGIEHRKRLAAGRRLESGLGRRD